MEKGLSQSVRTEWQKLYALTQ